MRFAVVTAAIVVAAVVAELVIPGRAVYHAGWFNVALIALAISCIVSVRKTYARTHDRRGRISLAAIALGAGVAAAAGAASGLLAPDNRTIVGAPGQNVAVEDLNATLQFPLVAGRNGTASSFGAVVVLSRPGRRPIPLGARGRDVGNAIVSAAPRDVVYVEARDLAGDRLTITQPAGSVFLSPVLLMQQTQTIAGLTLPFDSFALPAAHRVAKAVLFSVQQAATLRGLSGSAPAPAVLFAVEDENGRSLPHAIAIARDGGSVVVGGLRFHATVLPYPAVHVAAAPALAAVVAAAILFAGGLLYGTRTLL